jgi:hypothetical protein
MQVGHALGCMTSFASLHLEDCFRVLCSQQVGTLLAPVALPLGMSAPWWVAGLPD